MQQSTTVILPKNDAKKGTVWPKCKTLCLGQIQHNTSLSNSLLIFKHGGDCIMVWVCLILAKTKIKGNRME